MIGEHSKVIAAFVDTHDTKFGQLALSKLFEAADAVSIYLIDHQNRRAAYFNYRPLATRRSTLAQMPIQTPTPMQ